MINKYLDKQVILYLALFGIISCFFIYSSNASFSQYPGSFVLKQIIFYCIGFVLMVAIAILDLEQLKKIAWLFYFFIVLLLIGLIFAPESIAKPINGAKAWYKIMFIGTLQPSEFLKFGFLLVIAKTMENHQKKLAKHSIVTDSYLLAKIAAIVIPPMVIVYKQPDTGMLMLYLALIIPMIYFSTINRKILITFAAIPVTVVVTLMVLYFKFNDFFMKHIMSQLSSHQISRINGWLFPYEYEDSSLQARQGMLAIGSGEITGKGFLNNNVYIPEKHTDFIFAAIAEEVGFIGCTFIIFLYFLLLYRLIIIIMNTNDPFAYTIGAGIIGLFTFQIFQNISMTMGILPITGVTLPFLSYGGSSLLSNFMLIGVILSFKKTYHNYVFSSKEKEINY
ncbi:FtsW/RodA/SpoVE family cell cycle protein [Ureibacillus sp. Re31]|uniref:Rod shape-determining protein RodA n=2 Tax=Bacillales TaxID=1385 RepID=A0A3M8H443_9BACI|nr:MULTISPECIES: FtsW/RodA/SpoVE family cell cycle protein [Bacillales]MBD8025915.1 FtsW/RodA/SpoVE family cell cycle protein [Ureibacillus galli]RNC97202.1 rod shape-determining protein RodA [Lysinibacillus halotolerans]